MTDAPDPAAAYRRTIPTTPNAAGPADPLRLCVYATIAALSWLLGPFSLLAFAVLALVGYARARRSGLSRSKCLLGDTRLVLAYLALLAAGAGVGIALLIRHWFS